MNREEFLAALLVELAVSLEELSFDDRVTVAGSLWMNVLTESLAEADGKPVLEALVRAHAQRLGEAMSAIAAAKPEDRDTLAEFFAGHAFRAEGRPS